MFDNFLKALTNAAIAMAIKDGTIVEEDGVLLNKSTVDLVAEIEEANRQHSIDKALANNNRELFMQLTTKEGVNC